MYSHPPSQHHVRLWKRWLYIIVALFLVMYFFSSNPGQDGLDNTAHGPRLQGSYVNRGKVRLSDLIAVGIQLSEIAAHEILDVKAAGQEDTHVKGKTDEGVDEPVTEADGRSNSVFVNGLRQFFPGIQILSEETDPEVKHVDVSIVPGVQVANDHWLNLNEVLITVDPLDATKEFTENLTQYVTTMMCVVYKGRPIAGIINQPFLRDQGAIWGVALENGSKEVHGVQLRPPDSSQGSKVAISRSHTGAGADVVTEYIPNHTPLFAGGSGYKALTVLKGEAEAYVHVTKIKAWDVCAADAVVRSAGGDFSDLGGKKLMYYADQPLFTQGLIASASKERHEWYVKQLEPYANRQQ